MHLSLCVYFEAVLQIIGFCIAFEVQILARLIIGNCKSSS